ncbi:MAG TPA: hypothetical protein VKU40_03690, partial [Thermoanaerobaculia bacterium]|nr:hypothetical protein [Thermoanaerobaculia bacterium]
QLAAVFDRLHREMIENPEGALGTKLPEDSLGEIDRMALLADLLALMSRFGATGNAGEPLPHPLYNPPPGELRELYVNQDHATGKLGGEGPLDGTPVTFARFDGRWYVRIIQ